MTKKKLKMEQLIAGAILKFGNVSSLDISLLEKDFSLKYPDTELGPIQFDDLFSYIEINNGIISLTCDLDEEFKKKLNTIAGKTVNEYFDKFDMEEYVLRKIEHIDGVKEEEISKKFGKNQKDTIEQLVEKGLLESVWVKHCVYDDYKEVRLSTKGNVKLFKLDYAKEVNRFIEMLRALRYDVTLLDDFLSTQDLSLSVWNVLNLEKLIEFCNTYDRAINEENASQILFKKLKHGEKDMLDEEGKKLMIDMLSVYDNHAIYICHPNHIFEGTKPINRDVREMAYIDWDDIDVDKMYRINDYEIFLSPDPNRAFKYVHSRLGHQVTQEINKGNKDTAVSYLVVVEKYIYDCQENFLVRGIIKGDKDGYSIAFNPEYEETIPKSVFEKGLRMGDHETPAQYLVKRPNKSKKSSE